MMEQYLDGYAQANGLRDVDTRLKLLLGLGAILISLSSTTPWTPLFIAGTMAMVTLFLAKIPGRLYLTLLLIPLSFSVFSVLVILFVRGGGAPLFIFPVAGISLTVTTGSANLALLLIARTLGGMSSLFFIALSTPMIEIFSFMHSLRLPPAVIDLSMLIYHFIFVLVGEVISIYNAQTIRHGYTSLKRSVHSLAMLGGMLFIRAWRQGEELITAMDARCYDGKLELPGEQKNTRPVLIAYIVSYLAGCGVLSYFSSSLVIF
ncbi:MAG: cobalt ECF transporter T component CbiQ [Methanomicrobiales archaeon]|nr:cobalt ECF transporter T component CbiQ [Methanomicrobiales archaeon]